jgi:hypothetical protein
LATTLFTGFLEMVMVELAKAPSELTGSLDNFTFMIKFLF